MARVLAHNEKLAMATNNLALIAHLLDRRTYFHCPFPFGSILHISSRPAADVIALKLTHAKVYFLRV